MFPPKVVENAPKENIRAWLAYVKAKPLPMLVETPVRLASLLASSESTYEEVAEAIRWDPACCFNLFLLANRLKKDRSAEIKTPAQALSLLGIGRFAHWLKQTPKISPNYTNRFYREYVSSLIKGVLAGELALRWQSPGGATASINATATESPHVSNEPVYWATLLCHSPEWAMRMAAVSEYRQLEYEQLVDPVQGKRAQQEILGCELRQLNTYLAMQWRLPFLTQQSVSHKGFLTRKELAEVGALAQVGAPPGPLENPRIKTKVQMPGFSMQLANWLAKEAFQGLASDATLAAARIASVYLQEPLEQTLCGIKRVTVDTCRHYPLAGVTMPAEQMIMTQPYAQQGGQPIRSVYPQSPLAAELNAAPVAPTETSNEPESQGLAKGSIEIAPGQGPAAAGLEIASSTTSRSVHSQASLPSLDQARVQALCQRMAQQPASFKSLHELLFNLSNSLCTAVGLGRTVIALFNTERSRVHGYYAAGIDAEAPFAHYDMALGDLPLLAKLARNPGAIWVNEKNFVAAAAKLNKDWLGLCASEDFFLMSMFVFSSRSQHGEVLPAKPVAIVYGDAQGAKEALHTEQYGAFKQLCRACEQGIQYFSNLSKQREKPSS